MKKIAFVTPWYGPDIPGGAEADACRTAENLTQRGWPVEVLTTCLKDFHSDWGRNYHREGTVQINGVTVRRFRVERRNREAFDTVNRKLLSGVPIRAAEEQIYFREMINPPGLYRFMAEHRDDYFFFFIPYLFSTTYWGAQIAPESSCIITCLHDEPYARLTGFKELFPKMRALIYNTPAEIRLAERLYQLEHPESMLVGVGVDTDIRGDGERFRALHGLTDTPFVLYAGRRGPEKNTPLLLSYFARYKQSHPGPLKLVFIGSGPLTVPLGCEAAIMELGFVPQQEKYDAYAAATVLCQPSIHESFSLVMMESWLCGRPVLVHDQCEVTREHCLLSNGGLFFADYPEFEATLDYLLAHPAQAEQMGVNGGRYVKAHYAWDRIMEHYEAAFKRWGVADDH